MLLENKNSRGGRNIVARVSHVDGPGRERRGRDAHSFFLPFFILFLFCSCLVELFGGSTFRKGVGRRHQGLAATLFLYIDLYSVLLFLSCPFLFPYVSVIPGGIKATRLSRSWDMVRRLEVPAKGVVVQAGTSSCCGRPRRGGESTANYKLYDDRLDNETLDDTFRDVPRCE